MFSSPERKRIKEINRRLAEISDAMVTVSLLDLAMFRGDIGRSISDDVFETKKLKLLNEQSSLRSEKARLKAKIEKDKEESLDDIPFGVYAFMILVAVVAFKAIFID